MFRVPASAMKDISEYLINNPVQFIYPHLNDLAIIGALLTAPQGAPPIDQRYLDFVNYVNGVAGASNFDAILIRIEALAATIAEYDDISEDEAFDTMLGSFTPEFSATMTKWKEMAQDQEYETLYSEMAAIAASEPATISRAETIKEKIAEARRMMNTLDEENTGKASQITQNSMVDSAKQAIQTAQKALQGLQQLADWGFAADTPGQEFRKYLEGVTKDLQKAVDGGLAKLTNGALDLGGGLKIPAGIVDSMKTAFPEVGQVLNKISNVTNTIDQTASKARQAIDAVKKNIG